MSADPGDLRIIFRVKGRGDAVQEKPVSCPVADENRAERVLSRVRAADTGRIEHQLAQAKAAGFAIDETVSDNGVSGVSTRLVERPEGKRLFDKLRAGDTLVVRWVDWLGRNYDDVCETIREFMGRGVIIRTVINNFTSDGATKDPLQKAVRDALIGFMAATATIIEQLNRAIHAGLDDSSMKRRLAELGADGFTTSPVSFGKYIADYTQKWAGVIRQANIKL
jgi:resolvase-like protein